MIKGEQYFQTPKTEKSKRVVNIPQSLYKELQDYVASMAIEPDERIFYFQKSGMRSEFKRATARSGLPEIRIHDLRHSHASMLIDMKFSIKEISDRLGMNRRKQPGKFMLICIQEKTGSLLTLSMK